MKTKLIIFALIVLIVSGAAISYNLTKADESNFEQNRENILSQLYSAIEDAKEIGKYKCCIEPPCTMCYLGDWIWEDGTCGCDELIAKGEWDKVCPQCKKGIEEGNCKSEIGSCSVPI